jgi:hypothetical protein
LNLTAAELQLLLESVNYSIQRVSEAQGTPYDLRREKLQSLTEMAMKLKTAAANTPIE